MRHRFKTGEYVDDNNKNPWEMIEEEVGAINRNLMAGLLNFLVSTLLYAAIAWYVSRTLNDSGVITWRLDWVTCSTTMFFLQLARLWDRAFMR